MTRFLLVAQDKGGSGKTTCVRGLAEAAPGVRILEVDESHRLVEFDGAEAVDGGPQALHFPMRASTTDILRTGGSAALEEFDAALNALGKLTSPAVVDVGANTGLAFFQRLEGYRDRFKKRGLEVGVLVVVTSEFTALNSADDLVKASKAWAAAQFVVENRLHNPAPPDRLAKYKLKTVLGVLEGRKFDAAAIEILQARGMRDIPSLDVDALENTYGFARGTRIVQELEQFRADAMRAVQHAAEWLVE